MKGKKRHSIKHILYLIVVGLLCLPFLQQRFHFCQIKDLYGGFTGDSFPSIKELNSTTWFNGSYAERVTGAMKSNAGFRNFFIRLNNQYNFSLFGITENPNLVIGQNNCLFEEGYILAYLGRNFVGKELIDERLRRTQWVQDYLKREKNIDLIVVFEPGKGSYHSDYIPARYRPWDKQLSNYEYYVQRCRETGLRHIDLCAWFTAARDTSRYPLIPKYGVHWGTYGMMLAADSLVRYIEQLRGADLPEFDRSRITVTDQRKDVDFDWDAEQALNLLFRLPFQEMAYPELQLISDSNKVRPRVLTIADSYYWSMYNSGIPQHCFSQHQFWYYYRQEYPYIWDYSHPVSALNVKDSIEKQDVILVMITEMNLYQGFWGFTDDLYRWYCPDYRPDPKYDAMNKACMDDMWLRQHMGTAEKAGMRVEELLEFSGE